MSFQVQVLSSESECGFLETGVSGRLGLEKAGL